MPENFESKKQNIKKVTIVGMIVNVALSIMKLIIGFIGNSQALIADGIHSFSDLTTDFSIIFGVKFWLQPADREHPYGHHKIELLVTIVIALVLMAIGFGILFKAIFSLNSRNIQNAPEFITFFIALISIISKEVLYKYTIKQSEKLKSTALKANAWHHRSDAISSVPVAVAIIVSSIFPKLIFIDYIGAIIVSVFIIYPSFKMIKDAVSNLLDESVDKKTFDEISNIAQNIPNVINAHDIRTRKIGEAIFVDMHILVDKNITVKEGHDIAKEVKRTLLKQNLNILDVLIHIEPYEK